MQAILGDDMGLGKTIQTIGFLLAIEAWKDENDVDQHKPSTKTNFCDLLLVLVCAPATILENWERELIKWGGIGGKRFDVGRYTGTNRKSESISGVPNP